MPLIDNKYQENGFLLLTYKNRQPDPNVLCPECGRKTHHVATIYDEWSEAHSSFIYYHYCKREQIIIQRIARTDNLEQRHITTFKQPPAELLVELLATARQQNGRNVTTLTINRHWWAPKRYPLHLGIALEVDDEEVVDPVSALGEENINEIPITPYEPPASTPRNPFTSRPIASSSIEADSTHNEGEGASASETKTEAQDDETATPPQP
ncbi:MAG: hypothetical protein CUN55_07620 [Phototrophicales bacterium]|nr:MAG: hypothetical protein CUN55_07620 [Phototrophicales bacterium]